jgi:chorismate mutase
MIKRCINIKWDNGVNIICRAWVEQIISAWEDFAYGYDLEDAAIDDIVRILDELGIEYEITEEEYDA